MPKSHLDDLAPYPRTVQEVTADSLAKALAVRAHYRQSKLNDPRSELLKGRLFAMTAGTIVSEYGLIELLAALAKHAGVEVADEMARSLWSDWEDGQAVAVGLWQYVKAYGLDPDEVSRLAAEQRAEQAVTS